MHNKKKTSTVYNKEYKIYYYSVSLVKCHVNTPNTITNITATIRRPIISFLEVCAAGESSLDSLFFDFSLFTLFVGTGTTILATLPVFFTFNISYPATETLFPDVSGDVVFGEVEGEPVVFVIGTFVLPATVVFVFFGILPDYNFQQMYNIATLISYFSLKCYYLYANCDYFNHYTKIL